MRKTLLTTLSLLLLFSAYMPAQTDDANQAYIAAVTTQDPVQKAKLLKDFISKHGGKGVQNENYACATLCTLAYPGKTPQETVQYGEQAIALGGMDDLTAYRVCINVSGNMIHLGQNLAKAKTYADQAIQLARSNKNKSGSGNPAQWTQMEGAGYFAQGQALEKSNNLKGAVNSYINSYNILKNKQIIASLASLGKSLYDSKAYADAAKAFKLVTSVNNNFGSIVFYAKSLHRGGDKEGALTNYKKAYATQKSGEIAYNIGLILAGKVKSSPTVTDEAIKFLLEASFLSPANSQKAMGYAEGLYFNKDPQYNQKVTALTEKGKLLENLTNQFNETFGEKTEEDLTDEEKSEMEKILAQIDTEKKAIEKLQAEQQEFLGKFQALIDQTKKGLGLG